ncbi:O-antigen ligase family protein [Bilifractor sp. HCP3S3_D3]|uniref:O-antigen ligase family protein n=1 Tax=Bilifractor sp. HCP3S3_D3 TaxID=3438907 RepID=UPI003F8A807F
MKIKINTSNFIWYLALIPFLFPKGFAEYFSSYKAFSVLILGIATFIILARELVIGACFHWTIELNVPLMLILLYHIVLLVITISEQGTITEGLQKIFVAPAVCLLLAEGGRRNLFNIIDATCNILIIEFLLNILIFNQWFFPSYFLVNNHITFIGHVQVAAEIGILGVLISYAEYKHGMHKAKATLLIVLSFITMIYSKTTASYASIALITVLLLIGKVVQIKEFTVRHIKLITVILIALTFMWINVDNISIFSRFHNALVLYSNGRTFIWNQGIELFKEKPLFGYGAYGAEIRPFWVQWTNNGLGFNYAHNTILQLLLDGGIVLMTMFIIVLFTYLHHTQKNIKDHNIKYVIYVLFITFLFVGQFESITEYYYFFMFLSLIPYMRELEGESTT